MSAEEDIVSLKAVIEEYKRHLSQLGTTKELINFTGKVRCPEFRIT